MKGVNMSSTTHIITDDDFMFVIDPFLKTITYKGKEPVTLAQGDHNSERFTFEIPRYIEGHDMSLCNNIEIHYTNTSSGNSNTTKRSSDVYTVDDLTTNPSRDVLTFTWLISRNATMYAGTLKFAIRFAKIDGTIIDYAWATGAHDGVPVTGTINNTEAVPEQYSDVLQRWYQDLLTSKTEGLNAIEAAEQEATARIKAINVLVEAEQDTLDRIAAAGNAKIAEIQSLLYTGETAAV
jgi:hypothetical protein